MTRYLFDGGEVVIDAAGNAQSNYPFTVWTERVGGADVTGDIMAPDGVTPAAVETDADGEVPYLRGPDGALLLYRDMGTDTRTPWYSAEAVAQAFGAPLMELNSRPQTQLVVTGSELRPGGSDIIIWVSPEGVVPVNAAANDLVFEPDV